MEIFKLTSSIKVEDNGLVNVCLKPENESIKELIATYRTYENITLAESSLNGYIQEMTPLLFNDFKNMENVSIEIKNNFTL
jgi:hypothetical protein